MSTEYFNKRVTEVQEKLFDSEILVTGCVYDLLKEFSAHSALIYAEIPCREQSGGYRSFIVESIFLENESGTIFVSDNEGKHAAWDELDLSAKETVMNELFLRYSSDSIYTDLSGKDEIH